MLRIALLGDYNAQIIAHQAIVQSLELGAHIVQLPIHYDWLSTLHLFQNTQEMLKDYHAIWCAPGSPYVSFEGALQGIQFARAQKRPFLGTCGGFQHALIEYSRHVLSYQDADHAESNPDANMKLITSLSCSLVGQQREILIKPHSQVASIYQKLQSQEAYHCNYGLNPTYRTLLEQGGLVFSGEDQYGEARIFELPTHPFYIGTLFQPERFALTNRLHPLIQTFIQAALA